MTRQPAKHDRKPRLDNMPQVIKWLQRLRDNGPLRRGSGRYGASARSHGFTDHWVRYTKTGEEMFYEEAKSLTGSRIEYIEWTGLEMITTKGRDALEEYDRIMSRKGPKLLEDQAPEDPPPAGHEERGYRILRKHSGYESAVRRGTLYHAVRPGERTPVCGSPASQGWLEEEGTEVTCTQCLKKLGLVRERKVLQRVAMVEDLKDIATAKMPRNGNEWSDLALRASLGSLQALEMLGVLTVRPDDPKPVSVAKQFAIATLDLLRHDTTLSNEAG